MADKVVAALPELYTEDLSEWLHGLPKGTRVMLETAQGVEVDIVTGAVYFPRHSMVVLVGQNTELEIDESDWDTVETFGDISLYDETTETDSPPEDEAGDATDGIAMIELRTGPTEAAPRGEVDAPQRPIG